jgi:formylmethanofuran dehydrogenase subunit E
MNNFSKDNEFKIQLSVDDIDKLDDAIRGIDDDSKFIEKSNELQINLKNNQSIIKGLKLLNVCDNCKNEFIPKNSMIDEILCKSCLEK